MDKLLELLENGPDKFFDDNYDVNIIVYRKAGSGQETKICMEGNKVSLLTGTSGLLEALLRDGVADENELMYMVKMAVGVVKKERGENNG